MSDERWDPNPTFTLGASYSTTAGSKQVTAASTPIADMCAVAPPPDVPEAPAAVLLPLSAAAVLALGATAIAHRDRGAAIESTTAG